VLNNQHACGRIARWLEIADELLLNLGGFHHSTAAFRRLTSIAL
jgi:hypothetical protein